MTEEQKDNDLQTEDDIQMSGPQAAAKGREIFERVLRNRVVKGIAAHLKIPKSEIELNTPLMVMGLESLALFSMTGRLAEWMEQDIPVTLLFDIESINHLVLKMADIACPE